MRVAYIISIAHGMDAWTYREMEMLERLGIQVLIYPLRIRKGPYMPKEGWYLYRWKPLTLLWHQIYSFFRFPRTYLGNLFDSLKNHGFIYLLIASDFIIDMKKHRVDLIHCVFGDHKLYVGYYCKKLTNIPLSVALYGYELKLNPNWKLFKKSIPAADYIVVNCEYNRGLLGNIIDEATAKRALLIRHIAPVVLGREIHPLSILMVGGFVYRKGHDILFRAVQQLLHNYPEIELWIVGYSGEIDVKKVAENLGISSHVKVFEGLPDTLLEILYESCDIFCLPSRSVIGGVNEGLPVSIIEAMAHGKPVVASRLSGIPEILPEILVEEGDINGLALALESYITNPERRIMDGKRNAQIIREKCSDSNLLTMVSAWKDSL